VSKDLINLSHGNGGAFFHELLNKVIHPAFSPEGSEAQDPGDAYLLEPNQGALAFATDTHVISPRFFPGGDIGSLAAHGTMNDLAVMGARPRWLSCGLILEEGFEIEELKNILESLAKAAKDDGVKIVTGDTKVVERGAADGLYINTSGIGTLCPNAPKGISSVREDDVVIVSGTLGDHGLAIYSRREGISMESDLTSDSASIWPLVERAMEACSTIRCMRDPTRGGLATTLNEWCVGKPWGILLDESSIPLRDSVKGLCELLGFDPLYVANEGKVIMVVPPEEANRALASLKSHPLGQDAAVIGRIRSQSAGKVCLRTPIGGERIVDMLRGDQLPRIC
jgi:hydrogenase expression/formation protein HypE